MIQCPTEHKRTAPPFPSRTRFRSKFAKRTNRHAGATSRRRSAPARGRPTAQSTRGEGRDKKGRNPAQLHTQIACQQGKERTSSGPHIAPRYCRTAICRSGEQSMSLPSPPACGRGDGGGGDRRAEERRGGKECVRTCTPRGAPEHEKKKKR